MTTTRGYGDRARRRAVIAAVAALTWALAGAAVVLFVPLGTSESAEAAAASGRSTRSSYTLLEQEGPGLLVVLAIPVVLALAGVIGAATQRAWLTTGAAGVLMVGVLLAAASIGLFFVPAAIALLLAAMWTAAGARSEAEKDL